MDARTALERRARRMAQAGCYRQAWRALLGASMLETVPPAGQTVPLVGQRLHAHYAVKGADQ